MPNLSSSAPPKIVSGARCKVGFIDPNNNKSQIIGIYNTVQYSVRYDVTPAWILGRYSAAGLEYTAAEPVSISATGYRIVDHGPYAVGQLPKLQDLINGGELVFVIYDRVTNKEIAKISHVKAVGFDTTISAKQLEEMTLQYIGILHQDEEGATNEALGSVEIDEGL